MVLLEVIGVLFAIVALPVIITVIQEAITRQRYRDVPGPRQLPIVGCVRELLKKGLLECITEWTAEFGKIFVLRFFANTFVVVSDPDTIRTVMFKLTNHAVASFANAVLAPEELRTTDVYGLVWAKDDFWRAVRMAWQPAFSPASLRGYQVLMDKEALAFASKMQRLAAKAEAEGQDSKAEVDFVPEISSVTLGVVGTAAYGVDFNAPEYSGSSDGGLSLVQAGIDRFRTMSPDQRTKWAFVLALPIIKPVAVPLARALPDAPLAKSIRARRVLKATCLRLIDDWRARNGSGKPGVTRSAGGGIAPGSFLDLMLSARDKGTGRALTDDEIQAQVETFVLAGFETTATALTFSMYLLATNPDKARRMQQEIDQLLPPLPLASDGAEGAEPEPLTMEVVEKLVYTEAVLKETMRLFPPLPSTSRLVDKPMEICGRKVPAGACLMIPTSCIHHNKELWPEPEAFVPERFLPSDSEEGAQFAHLAGKHPQAYLPFGAGSRMCIGFKFAMQEAKTVLARLFQRCSFELAPSQEVPLQLIAGFSLAPKNGVHLRVRSRVPQAAAAATTAAD